TVHNIAAAVTGADPGECLPGTDVVPRKIAGDHGNGIAPFKETDVDRHRANILKEAVHVAPVEMTEVRCNLVGVSRYLTAEVRGAPRKEAAVPEGTVGHQVEGAGGI